MERLRPAGIKRSKIANKMEFRFKAIFQSSGWVENVIISTDGSGTITAITEGGQVDNHTGFALPGFRNCHSHAFQYAMAGLAECHSPESSGDDFWTWRKKMYGLALTLDPDQVEAIAAVLYSEMVRLGHTHVVEFHYLHHDKDGAPYSDPAEMGARLVAAAKTAGINITLVPIFYQMGGFGKDPLPEQRRFISNTLEEYAGLVEASARACENYEGARIGTGVHSLRAVSSEDIPAACELRTDAPFHIHISEQIREVEQCVEMLGASPIEWLLENVAVDHRFNFVHATHANDSEVIAMASAGANVVICPTTEGNLGDGIFPLRVFESAGGLWSIGTDSHVGLDPFEELRLLDYGQRLTTHRRDTFIGSSDSSAENAFRTAARAGMHGTGEPAGEHFEIGKPLNACVIGDGHPLLTSSSIDSIADRILYAPEAAVVESTIINGRMMSENGRHVRGDETRMRFESAIGDLAGEL